MPVANPLNSHGPERLNILDAGMTYRTVVADPPWPYDREPLHFAWRRGRPSGDGKPMLAYPTMPLDAIAALPVSRLAAPDAHLYVWTTQRFMRAAYDVAEA